MKLSATKPIYIILLIIINFNGNVFSKWIKQHIPLGGEVTWQNALDISFSDSLNGMIATNYIFPSTLQLTLPTCLRTSDGGNTWISIKLDSSIYCIDSSNGNSDTLFKPYNFVKISYLDSNCVFGLIVEDYSVKVPAISAIIHSTDKGSHWNYFILDKDTNNIGVALKMLNKKTGMVATRRFVYLTDDSGKTWNKKVIPDFDSLNKYIIWDGAYLDSKDIILLVIHHGDRVNCIFKSNDNGITWKKFSISDSSYWTGTSIFFLDKNNGWRCTEEDSRENGLFKLVDRIYFSTDEGETWAKTYEKSSYYKSGADYLNFPFHLNFWDKDNGIAYNEKLVAMLTSDGGKNWISQFPKYDEIPYGDTIYQFTGMSYAGSKDNIFLLDYSYSALFHYTPEPDNINDESFNIGSGNFLSPNPATDFLEISLHDINPMLKHGVDDAGSGLNIEIFSVLGTRLLSKPVNLTPTLSMLGEGVRIDVSGLPTGIYFVKVGDKVGKFVKL